MSVGRVLRASVEALSVLVLAWLFALEIWASSIRATLLLASSLFVLGIWLASTRSEPRIVIAPPDFIWLAGMFGLVRVIALAGYGVMDIGGMTVRVAVFGALLVGGIALRRRLD